MAKVFTSNLSVKGLRQLQKELIHYRKYTLTNNVQRLVEELADSGIRVAYLNSGEFAPYIAFVKEVEPTKYNYQAKALLVGSNAVPNIQRWISYDGITTAEVNSLMMAEYGSGQYARYGYRGTFPNQTHAMEDSWWYATEIGANGLPTNWHRNYGVKPTMPIYKAWVDILTTVIIVGRRVFQ